MGQQIDEPRGPSVIRKTQSAAVAKREFMREAIRIRDGWVRRRAAPQITLTPPATVPETPQEWMLRQTYRLVRALVRKGHADILAELVDGVGQRHHGKTAIDDKPFKQALLVMFWWNPEHTSAQLLDHRRRHELSAALEYAHLHGVQPRYLNAFIKSAGIKRTPLKLRDGVTEPPFGTRR